jgi:hypothetical protein
VILECPATLSTFSRPSMGVGMVDLVGAKTREEGQRERGEQPHHDEGSLSYVDNI